MRHRLLVALLAAASTAAAAEPIDAGSLLSAAALAELGVPANAIGSLEQQQHGGVEYCRYLVPGVPAADSPATVIWSRAVPDRVRQARAMMSMAASQGSPAQLEARGEFIADNATCKVVAASRVETTQCLGTTEQSVVGLTLRRATQDTQPAYPAVQLRFVAKLVAGVAAAGG
jgi:hypothetical protein